MPRVIPQTIDMVRDLEILDISDWPIKAKMKEINFPRETL